MPTQTSLTRTLLQVLIIGILQTLGATAGAASDDAIPPPLEKMTPIDAWAAVPRMTPSFNIGNTLENTAHWETGWGNPLITREFIQSVARLGFKSVRLPVAWDTYAQNGHITPQQFSRVAEVVNWITDAGMYCVINIHWDGGWIDSASQQQFPTTYHTFSPKAEKKFESYWDQISRFFAGKNEKLIFEDLNEESDFSKAGSVQKAYDTLTHVNQLFIDTVRHTGENNADRLLIVAGYTTDIAKTCDPRFTMPHDTTPGKLFLSIHYYTPWQFAGMTTGRGARPTWGTPADIQQLNSLFDTLQQHCTRTNTPVYLGEFGVVASKDAPSRIRWLSAVANAAIKRKMVPALWDTGGEISRRPPYAPSKALTAMLGNIKPNLATPATAPKTP